MSADNWTICPNCVLLNEQERERIQRKLGESYGIIPFDQYIALVEKGESIEEITETTLREDYEIGIYNGEFSIKYRCHCLECNFSYDYDFEQHLPIEKENDV